MGNWLSGWERRGRFRRATARLRSLPGFVLAGAMKCGTTSLFEALAAQPGILASAVKEPHYFDIHYRCGTDWYRSHFPLRSLVRRARAVVGEGTPTYLLHPHAAGRMAALIPNARLILILRRPLDRAYSHYQHMIRSGHERLPFEAALEAEAERLAGPLARLEADPLAYDPALAYYSYAAAGRYAEQIQRLLRYYSREQLLVVTLEAYREAPARVQEEVRRFLALPTWTSVPAPHLNRGGYPPPDPALRTAAERYFAGAEEAVSDLLGVRLWPTRD
jgi:hypothetical protein